MATPPEGMTLLTIKPENFEEIVERSQKTENPYTMEELEQLRSRYKGNNSVGVIAFFEPDFWTRERDDDEELPTTHPG